MKRVSYNFFLITFLISFILLSINIIDKIYYEEESNENISLYYEKQDFEEKLIDIENEYIGIINIPSINLTQGFFHFLSTNNNLSSGIMNIKDDMDNVLVLASHSGRSNKAKFNNLRKMSKGDYINLSYNNEDFIYVFDHSYKVEKTGHVYVKYDKSLKTLILITCDLSNNNKQIVYVSYML